MANTVLIKKSGVANAVPGTGDLSYGELALNYNDGNLFYKNSGDVVTVIASNKFVSVSGNVVGNNINGTTVSTTGNITAGPGAYFIGDGSQLTGVGSADRISNGTSNVDIPTVNGPVTVGVGGIGNVAVF